MRKLELTLTDGEQICKEIKIIAPRITVYQIFD